MAKGFDVPEEVIKEWSGLTEEQIRRVVVATLATRDAMEAQEKEAARKKKEADPFTRMTFIVRKEYLTALREYADQNRISQKEALDKALESFFIEAKKRQEREKKA